MKAEKSRNMVIEVTQLLLLKKSPLTHIVCSSNFFMSKLKPGEVTLPIILIPAMRNY